MADNLGRTINMSAYLSLMEGLSRELPSLHFVEEVFYRILGNGSTDAFVAAALKQMENDHRRFEDSIPEIAEQLEGICSTGNLANREATGYALRCLFEGIRQHQAWEDITLLGCLSRSFSAAEVAQFHAGIARNRRGIDRRFRFVPPLLPP